MNYATLSNVFLVFFLLTTSVVLSTDNMQSTVPTTLKTDSEISGATEIPEVNKANTQGSIQITSEGLPKKDLKHKSKKNRSQSSANSPNVDTKLSNQQEDSNVLNGRRNKLRRRIKKNINMLQQSLNETATINSNDSTASISAMSNSQANITQEKLVPDRNLGTNSTLSSDIMTKMNKEMEEAKIPITSDISIFLNKEIDSYDKNHTEFKGACKEFLEDKFKKQVQSEVLSFDTKSIPDELIVSTTIVVKKPESFKQYLDNCFEVYRRLDQAEKIKEALTDYSKRLDKEIEEFEKSNPQTFGDSLIDIFFSYNYFKKNFFKALVGKGDNESIAEEYERTVFRNKRLDSLIKISFESYLFDLHEKYDNLYSNNTNKLKSKVPLENQSFDEVVKTKEFKTWVSGFISEHPEFNLDEASVTKRLGEYFSNISSDFKTKLLAQESNKGSLSSAVYY